MLTTKRIQAIFYTGGGAMRPDYEQNELFINQFRFFQSKTDVFPDITNVLQISEILKS